MDYINYFFYHFLNHLFVHDVAERVGNPGVIGAIAAGLAMFALLSGVAKIQRKSVPKEFPGDPEALQAKYLLAFRQLEDASNDSPEGVKGLLTALKTNPAAYMALEAFGKYKSKQKTLPEKGGKA
ncbi:hypothetical protein KBI23_23985 [bacterium]|nr:hypothetical protein [bacterium]